MIYEEKLQKIVTKCQIEREMTRKGFKTSVTFDDHSFTKVRIADISKMLLQLQDDHGVIRILHAYGRIDENDPYDPPTVSIYDVDYIGSIVVELDEQFDKWYKKFSNKFVVSKPVEAIPVWDDSFHWIDKMTYSFGKLGQLPFDSEDRAYIFRALTEKRGYWATMKEMIGGKDDGYVRKSIEQIRKRFTKALANHIEIIPTIVDDNIDKPNESAYRIRVTL